MAGNKASPRLNGQPFVVAIPFCASPIGRKLRAPSVFAHTSTLFKNRVERSTDFSHLPLWKLIFQIVVPSPSSPTPKGGKSAQRDIPWKSQFASLMRILSGGCILQSPGACKWNMKWSCAFGTCFSIRHRNTQQVTVALVYEFNSYSL